MRGKREYQAQVCCILRENFTRREKSRENDWSESQIAFNRHKMIIYEAVHNWIAVGREWMVCLTYPDGRVRISSSFGSREAADAEIETLRASQQADELHFAA